MKRTILGLIAFVILATSFLYASPGCSSAKNAGKAAVSAAIDCSKENVKQLVKESGLELLGSVIAVVSAGGEGWKETLTNLGKDVGERALACAVVAARAGFQEQYGEFLAGPTPRERADAFVRERGWKFAPPPSK